MEHIHALEHLALLARIRETDHTLAFVDGVLNLLTKANRAIDTGTPEGRERARAFIDRAERYLPDSTDLDPQGQEGIDLARSTIHAVRYELDVADLELQASL